MQDNDFRRGGSLANEDIQNKGAFFNNIFAQLLDMKMSRQPGDTVITLHQVSGLMQEVREFTMQSQAADHTTAPTMIASTSSGSASGPQVTQEADL